MTTSSSSFIRMDLLAVVLLTYCILAVIGYEAPLDYNQDHAGQGVEEQPRTFVNLMSKNDANETGMIIPKDSSQANETGMIIPKDFSQANETGMIIPKDSSPGVKCGSHSIAAGTTIEFVTKDYPNQYPRNYKCSWSFQGTNDIIELELDCESFNLPRCLSGSRRKRKLCQKKNMLVLKGGNGKVLKRYRGIEGPEYFSVEGNQLSIKLMSKVRAKGFSCSITAYSSDEFETATAATAAATTTTTTTTTKSPNASTSCQCGRTYKRIVGGSESGVNEYPWQVGLVVAGGGQPFCGASIVGRRHVLTAAHCTKAITDNGMDVEILVGDHDVSSNSDTPMTARIPLKSIIQHSQYNTETLQNDIALIELESALDLDADPRLAPVCLPPAGKLFVGANAIVAGWGKLEEGGSQPQTLQHVILPVISNDVCKESYGSAIFPNSLCAGYVEGGKDSCQGDSGGPLVTEDDSVMVQIGVVSFGYGCARPNIPGVYARVTEYLDWIKTHTGSEDTCA